MTKENERKRAYLLRYKEARYAELGLRGELTQVLLSASAPGISYDRVGSGSGTPHGLEVYAIMRERVEEDLKKSLARWQRIRSEIEGCIDVISNQDERILLRLRYIELQDIRRGGELVGYRQLRFREISTRMGYSRDRISHMHGDALRDLVIPTEFDI